MNSEPSTPFSRTTPPVSFIVPVDDDLRKRLDQYVKDAQLDQWQLIERLFNDALRQFLGAHAPIHYPQHPQKQ